MKINCVILNYNDAELAMRLAARIRDYQELSHIIVVDNGSTDDSVQKLKMLQDEKITVLCAGENRGYGAGNNLGVRYSVEQTGATHVIIANPDTMFSEECVQRLAELFRKHAEVGVAAASMEDPVYQSQRNGWKLHGFVGELLSMGPISRRLFHQFLVYPERYFQGKRAVFVDAVHGSMLMVDAALFLACGGYDESIFLYQEEAVLGQKMKKAGKRTVLLLDVRYHHDHSATIGKSFQSQAARQKLRHESVMYYFKEYLRIGKIREGIANLWFSGILAEIWIFCKVQKRP